MPWDGHWSTSWGGGRNRNISGTRLATARIRRASAASEELDERERPVSAGRDEVVLAMRRLHRRVDADVGVRQPVLRAQVRPVREYPVHREARPMEAVA